MDGLFSCGRFTGFGPNRFDPWLHANAVHQVEGGRPSTLRARLRELCPRRPGVYAMINAHGTLIYLGKAKALRPRLLSYFRPQSRSQSRAHPAAKRGPSPGSTHRASLPPCFGSWS